MMLLPPGSIFGRHTPGPAAQLCSELLPKQPRGTVGPEKSRLVGPACPFGAQSLSWSQGRIVAQVDDAWVHEDGAGGEAALTGEGPAAAAEVPHAPADLRFLLGLVFEEPGDGRQPGSEISVHPSPVPQHAPSGWHCENSPT